MANLKWKNLYCNEGQWYVSIVTAKTDGPLVLPLSSKAMDLPNQSMTNTLLKSWIWSAGIHKKICFHTSRHTFATMLLTLGVDLYTVSKLPGHSNVKTTQIYAKMVDSKKVEAVHLLDNAF